MSITLKQAKDYVRSKVKELKANALLDNMLTIDFTLAVAKVQSDLTELKIKDNIKIAYLDGNVIVVPTDLMAVPNAIKDIRASAGVKASGTTSIAGINNDLTFTAVEPGTPGNGIRIIYTDSGTEPMSVSTDLYSKIITINFNGTLPSDEISAAGVMALINNDPMASLLVVVTPKTNNNGTGGIAASDITLTGGSGDGWRPADERSIVDANRMEESTIEQSSVNFPKFVKRGNLIQLFPKTITYVELTYIYTEREFSDDSDIINVPITHRELVFIEVIRKAYESLDLQDKMAVRQTEYEDKLRKLNESYQRGLSSTLQDHKRLTEQQ